MALKAWHQIVSPRGDLKEGRPLDASEFAVHLDNVRLGKASPEYVQPERFFNRTYLTVTLREMAAQVVRRLNGITSGTSPVFNLTTQFGGGKTHSLTLLYHLAKSGPKSKYYQGVDEILHQAGVDEIPITETAVFVGTEFSSVSGRGNTGEPLRRTPWGEMAFQVGGAAGYEYVRLHDEQLIAPGGDDLEKLFDPNKPYLLLFDELMNYISRHRHYQKLSDQFYNFLLTLSGFVAGRSNIILVISVPASEMEMTEEDVADFNRLQKMLNRLGKSMFMSAGNETTEIIRRRLFDWNGVPPEAKPVISQYVNWAQEHRTQLPGTFNVDAAREQFEAAYPFHPQVLSLFERKWNSLPKFQQTRGVLKLLALWVAKSYADGYQKPNVKDSLISLGTAPLDDANFRAAVFGQLGEGKLEAAVTTDIAGKVDAHADRLDAEAIESVRKARLHRKCATTIFFESNGGQTSHIQASIPEIKLNIGEPDLDIGLMDSVLQSLLDSCYYLTATGNKYKFSTQENLTKRFSDRKASIPPVSINELVEAEVRKVFDKGTGIDRTYFPEKNNQVPDRASLSLVVMHPSKRLAYSETKALLDDIVRYNGQTSRTYKSGLLFCVADDDTALREEARKKLTWDAIGEDANELRLDDDQKRQIRDSSKRAEKDLVEAVWKTYKTLLYLGRDNILQEDDLGLIHSSQARSLPEHYLAQLINKGEVTDEIAPSLLVRNWPPAFVDGWSTKNIRDTLYASPKFARPLKGDSVKKTVAKGVSNGILAYVGKMNDKYEPFLFNQLLSPADVEISDDMYILTAAEAQKHIEPRRLTTLKVIPPSYITEPNKLYAFLAKGYDQHGDEISMESLSWETTAGYIDSKSGKLTVGSEEGIFQVFARCGSVSASATITIERREITKDKGPNTTVSDEFTNETAKRSEFGEETTHKKMAWSGHVEPKKWTVFYTKVLSRLAANPNLKIKVNFELEDDALTDQKMDEMRAALKEMGLDDTIR